jgi:hypothetical protein
MQGIPDEVTPEYVAQQPLVMEHTGGAVHGLVMRWLSERAPMPRPLMYLGTTEALKSAVASNLGMSIVPQMAVAEPVPEIVVRPLRPLLSRTLALIGIATSQTSGAGDRAHGAARLAGQRRHRDWAARKGRASAALHAPLTKSCGDRGAAHRVVKAAMLGPRAIVPDASIDWMTTPSSVRVAARQTVGHPADARQRTEEDNEQAAHRRHRLRGDRRGPDDRARARVVQHRRRLAAGDGRIERPLSLRDHKPAGIWRDCERRSANDACIWHEADIVEAVIRGRRGRCIWSAIRSAGWRRWPWRCAAGWRSKA